MKCNIIKFYLFFKSGGNGKDHIAEYSCVIRYHGLRNGEPIYISGYEETSDGNGGKGGRGGFSGLNGSISLFLLNTPTITELNLPENNLHFVSGTSGNSGEPGKRGQKNYQLNNESTIKESEEGYKHEINLYKLGTEYIEFMTKLNPKTYNNQLINFTSGILIEKYMPSIMKHNKLYISNLIKRSELLNAYEYRHYLAILKDSIFFIEQDKIIIDYILATITSTLIRHKSKEDSLFIIDVKKCIDLTLRTFLNQISSNTSLAQQEIRATYAQNYENNLLKKITDSSQLILTLQKDIEINEKEIDNELIKVIKEIDKLKEESETEQEKLNIQFNKLKQNLYFKVILLTYKIRTSGLVFAGPKGMVAAGVIYAGLDGLETIMQVKDYKSKLNASNEFIESLKKYLNEQNDVETKKIDKELKTLEKKVNKKSVSGTTKERIDKLPDSKEKYKLELKYEENVYTSKVSAMKRVDKKKHAQNVKGIKNKISNAGLNEKLDKVTNVVNVLEMVDDLFDEYNLSDQEIKNIKEEIEKNSESFSALDEMKNKLDELRIGTMESVRDELDLLNGSSVAVLDFKKWTISVKLGDLKSDIFGLVNGLENKKQIEKLFERIEIAIDTMIQIYKHIEGFIQQSELVNYMNKLLNIPNNQKTMLPYKDVITKFENVILKNLITEKYEQALKAFSYWSFPFFCEYTHNIEMPNSNKIKNVNDMISKYSIVMSKLLEIIDSSETKLKPNIDNYLQSYLFTRETPIFKWSSKTNPVEIKQFLKGERITLNANVKYSKFDALKFSKLYILIEISSKSLNNTLQNILKEFFIELTHPGVSNFKFKNNFYSINSNFDLSAKLKLIDKYSSTNSDYSNETKKKIEENKPMLSPFTLWEMKIDTFNQENKIQLLNSINFIVQNNSDTETIVYLLGKGQYVLDSVKLEYDEINCMKE